MDLCARCHGVPRLQEGVSMVSLGGSPSWRTGTPAGASDERHSRPRNLTVASIAPKSDGVAK